MIALAREADRSWMADALCRNAEPDLWFPSAGLPSAWALEICCRCDVREQCANYADAHYERHGVWGGLTLEQRNRRARLRNLEPAGQRSEDR